MPDEMDAAQHADTLRRHVIDVIVEAAARSPRSLQAEMGPSEVGEPCARQLAYKLLGTEPVNRPDPWRSVVGTAVHAWLGDKFDAKDTEVGGGRYLVEVPVDPGRHPGTSDLFILGRDSLSDESVAITLDTLSGTVADWKIKSKTQLAKLRRYGPSQRERVQLSMYGKGQRRAGQTVRWLSLVALPQSGTLSECYVWTEPFSEAPADWAIRRIAEITDAVVSLDVETYPSRMAAIPATPNDLCPWCPFFLPGSSDPGRGCAGSSTERTAQ
jgi:hypothetical protein